MSRGRGRDCFRIHDCHLLKSDNIGSVGELKNLENLGISVAHFVKSAEMARSSKALGKPAPKEGAGSEGGNGVAVVAKSAQIARRRSNRVICREIAGRKCSNTPQIYSHIPTLEAQFELHGRASKRGWSSSPDCEGGRTPDTLLPGQIIPRQAVEAIAVL